MIPPYADRVMKKVQLSTTQFFNGTPCWIWMGYKKPEGYGQVNIGKTAPVHRVVYEIYGGTIPSGYHLDHLCRNPPCCNPQHLEPLTPADHARRTIESTMTLRGSCINGHPLELRRKRTTRNSTECVICSREQSFESYHRNKILTGEGSGIRNRRKTHCPAGHEYTPENTQIRKKGFDKQGNPKFGRDCKTCKMNSRRKGNYNE